MLKSLDFPCTDFAIITVIIAPKGTKLSRAVAFGGGGKQSTKWHVSISSAAASDMEQINEEFGFF